MKICFVGQDNYFRKQVEADLDDLYEVTWKNITFGGVGNWSDLLDVEADVFVFFMPHTVPPQILTQLQGKIVGKHAEPLPKFINGRTYVESIDTLARFQEFMVVAKRFKYLYHHDKTSLPVLEREGIQAKEFISPIAIGTYYPEEQEKIWEAIFLGKDTPWRAYILSLAKHQLCGRFLQSNHGMVGNELRRILNKTKIGINVHTENLPALEDRLQIYMACKLFVLSQPLSHRDFFRPGVHFVEFGNDNDLWNKVQYYLEHENEREAIAQAGYELVTQKLAAKIAWPRLINEVMGHET